MILLVIFTVDRRMLILFSCCDVINNHLNKVIQNMVSQKLIATENKA